MWLTKKAIRTDIRNIYALLLEFFAEKILLKNFLNIKAVRKTRKLNIADNERGPDLKIYTTEIIRNTPETIRRNILRDFRFLSSLYFVSASSPGS
jgi:hypothetical protein